MRSDIKTVSRKVLLMLAAANSILAAITLADPSFDGVWYVTEGGLGT